MTLNHTYDLPPRVGRKKEFPNRVTLTLSDEMLTEIDLARVGEEDRLALIRAAIERELKRRGRSMDGEEDFLTLARVAVEEIQRAEEEEVVAE